MKILPEDTREYSRQLESLPDEQRGLLVPRALLAALARFGATRSVQDASTVAHGVCQSVTNTWCHFGVGAPQVVPK